MFVLLRLYLNGTKPGYLVLTYILPI